MLKPVRREFASVFEAADGFVVLLVSRTSGWEADKILIRERTWGRVGSSRVGAAPTLSARRDWRNGLGRRGPSVACAGRWGRPQRGFRLTPHPPVPRGSKRFGQLHAGRAAVEREFGRLKNEYGLAPLRVRNVERVTLHADLTMLARLSLAVPERGRYRSPRRRLPTSKKLAPQTNPFA